MFDGTLVTSKVCRIGWHPSCSPCTEETSVLSIAYRALQACEVRNGHVQRMSNCEMNLTLQSTQFIFFLSDRSGEPAVLTNPVWHRATPIPVPSQVQNYQRLEEKLQLYRCVCVSPALSAALLSDATSRAVSPTHCSFLTRFSFTAGRPPALAAAATAAAAALTRRGVDAVQSKHFLVTTWGHPRPQVCILMNLGYLFIWETNSYVVHMCRTETESLSIYKVFIHPTCTLIQKIKIDTWKTGKRKQKIDEWFQCTNLYW